MALVKAQCTNCGAALEVDNAKDAAVCPFCNTPYIVEKAIQQFSINAVGTIHADVLNVVDDKSGKALEAAEACLKLSEFESAVEKFSALAQSTPQNARVWYGYARALTRNGTINICAPLVLETVEQAYKHAIVLDPNIDKDVMVVDWEPYLKELRQNVERKAARMKSECEGALEDYEEALKRESRWVWLFPFIGLPVWGCLACLINPLSRLIPLLEQLRILVIAGGLIALVLCYIIGSYCRDKTTRQLKYALKEITQKHSAFLGK